MDTNVSINSIEQVLKAIIKEYGYDENNPRLEILIFSILLHICELDEEDIPALFPITRGEEQDTLAYMAKMYIITKGRQQLLNEIMDYSKMSDKNKAIEKYSKQFCKRKLHNI